jgi:hypothetical protein
LLFQDCPLRHVVPGRVVLPASLHLHENSPMDAGAQPGTVCLRTKCIRRMIPGKQFIDCPLSVAILVILVAGYRKHCEARKYELGDRHASELDVTRPPNDSRICCTFLSRLPTLPSVHTPLYLYSHHYFVAVSIEFRICLAVMSNQSFHGETWYFIYGYLIRAIDSPYDLSSRFTACLRLIGMCLRVLELPQ